MTEQLAIIKEVRVGQGDFGFPVISFATYISEGVAAGQFFALDSKEAKELLNTVSDAKNLNGSACWVECDGNMIHYLRPFKK